VTRINLGIASSDLCDQHLLAEYRELPRIWSDVSKLLQRGEGVYHIPNTFTLGTGHVCYFRNKGRYLHTRWESLCAEMRGRGFAVNLQWREWPSEELYQDIPQETEVAAAPQLQARICDRLRTMTRSPTWTRCIPPTWAVEALRGRGHALSIL
jgi:deoxyribonuclease (pyrimidine dimer)